MHQSAAASFRWRLLLPVICCLLLGVVATRSAVVDAYGIDKPDLASRVWSGHPTVLIQGAMAKIGIAAANGRPPSVTTLEAVRHAAARSPLAVEPFLVEGTARLAQGHARRGEQLLSAALRRDPRSLAARHLLADLYARQGRVEEALEQIAAIGQRSPAAYQSLAPAVANVARSPDSRPAIRSIIRRDGELKSKVLAELARDPANTDLVLSLAEGARFSGVAPQPWQTQLVDSLVAQADYGRARAVWGRLHGVQPPTDGLFNAGFAGSSAPPPFNWQFADGTVGMAEPTGAGAVRLTSFGRADVTLASQLLLLSPGRWQLAYRVKSEPAAADRFRWAIRCLPGGEQPFQASLGTGERTLTFRVAANNCRAQALEIQGVSTDLPNTVEAEVGGLRLARIVP